MFPEKGIRTNLVSLANSAYMVESRYSKPEDCYARRVFCAQETKEIQGQNDLHHPQRTSRKNPRLLPLEKDQHKCVGAGFDRESPRRKKNQTETQRRPQNQTGLRSRLSQSNSPLNFQTPFHKGRTRFVYPKGSDQLPWNNQSARMVPRTSSIQAAGAAPHGSHSFFAIFKSQEPPERREEERAPRLFLWQAA